ncbi:MAG: glucosaminidase domain-containing protein, partial [Treponema sp.]|nr:glucosaminidase domain-containing protein [Treponema sp.]
MNGKHIPLFTALAFPMLLFFSCAGLKPAERGLLPEAVTVPPEVPRERPPEQAVTLPPEAPHERPPEQAVTLPPEIPHEQPPERPDPPQRIMGKGRIPGEELALFLERNNPAVDREFALALAGYYIEEAALEGVNHDAAFAQMCLETGFLSYGGLVTPEMNNFCGLGSIGPGQSGETFPDTRTG